MTIGWKRRREVDQPSRSARGDASLSQEHHPPHHFELETDYSRPNQSSGDHHLGIDHRHRRRLLEIEVVVKLGVLWVWFVQVEWVGG